MSRIHVEGQTSARGAERNMDEEDVHTHTHSNTNTTEIATESEEKQKKKGKKYRKIIEHHLHLIGFKRFLSSVTNRFNSNIFFLCSFASFDLTMMFLLFADACVGRMCDVWFVCVFVARCAVYFSTWWS